VLLTAQPQLDDAVGLVADGRQPGPHTGLSVAPSRRWSCAGARAER
jgi:hypothetical protein